MKGKKGKIKKTMEKSNADKIKVCTEKFCVCGCLNDDMEIEDVVVLDDAEVTPHSDKEAKCKKDRICICDEYIMAFEPVKKEQQSM